MEHTSTIALRVSRTTILINFLLSFFKLAAGLLAHSGAMVSDAVHSASDVFSTVIVIIGMKAAGKASDKEHPYGHERMECVAAIVLAVVLLMTGLFIGYEGVQKIRFAKETPLPIPGLLALAAAVISIAVKEAMYHYTRAAAQQIHSDALMADAWHHRSDALSSIGALLGIGGARLGFPLLDPIASLVICLMIGKAAYDIFHDA
ncbi:MAG: cation transporter, partial [Clostridia bacterium]|nr:cation transporter [Clostridia bacterium]